MTLGFLDGDVFRGLAFRILVFLTLALLPFGVIAVIQTQQIARSAERNAELSLLGLTEQAATVERAAIQEAFGTAMALGSIIQPYIDQPEACSRFLATYRENTATYSHVGYIPLDGMIECTSSMRRFDWSQIEEFEERMANPRRAVRASPTGPLSGQPVIVIYQPLQIDGTFAGYLTLSLPLPAIRSQERAELQRKPEDVVIFNSEGRLLLSDRGIATTEADLPRNRSLKLLVGEDGAVFSDENADGEPRVYSIVPIVSGVVYSMSVWHPADLPVARGAGMLSSFLPVAMWLASLIVAFWSLNRLAIRHIRKLGRQMRLFAYNRAMPRSTLIGRGVPRELVEMQQAFIGMAESIIRDEAALEDNIRDKNILLKEVHHRVKNNLQLISSIMNMQIRRAQSEDARFVLKRLQERILSLATVHKNLYQSDNALDRVDAGALLKEIVRQLLHVGLPAGAGVKVEKSFDAVEMDADDAAPLTLLVSEAVTNAMKYIGRRPDTGEAKLEIGLHRVAQDRAEFRIANTTGTGRGPDGTGLGSQLINAFARQLNGEVDVTCENGLHVLSLSFPVTYRSRTTTDY